MPSQIGVVREGSQIDRFETTLLITHEFPFISSLWNKVVGI